MSAVRCPPFVATESEISDSEIETGEAFLLQSGAGLYTVCRTLRFSTVLMLDHHLDKLAASFRTHEQEFLATQNPAKMDEILANLRAGTVKAVKAILQSIESRQLRHEMLIVITYSKLDDKINEDYGVPYQVISHVSPLPGQIGEASVKIVRQSALKPEQLGKEVPLTTSLFKEKVDMKQAAQGDRKEQYSEILLARPSEFPDTQQRATPPQPPSDGAVQSTNGKSDQTHRVIQGLDSNLFVVKGNTLYTAPTAKETAEGTADNSAADLAYGGDIRHIVLLCCAKIGVTVQFKAPMLSDVEAWDGAFLTNAIDVMVEVVEVRCPATEADTDAETQGPFITESENKDGGEDTDQGVVTLPTSEETSNFIHRVMCMVVQDLYARSVSVATIDSLSPIWPAPACSKLRQLLRKSFKVTISDGRIIYGSFQCMDQEKNLILANAEEEKPKENNGAQAEATPTANNRRLGMVMIPGKHLVKCELLDAAAASSPAAAEGQ